MGIIEFEWPGRNKDDQRYVKKAIYIGKIRLSPTDRKRKKTRYEIVETHVIIASEIDVLKNKTPLEWILLMSNFWNETQIFLIDEIISSTIEETLEVFKDYPVIADYFLGILQHINEAYNKNFLDNSRNPQPH